MTTEQTAGQATTGERQLLGDQDIGELVGQISRTVEEYVQEKPHTALAIAAAIGFVIGGGLTPRRLLRLGFAAGGPFLSRQLSGELFNMVTSTIDEVTQSEPASERKAGKRRSKRPGA